MKLSLRRKFGFTRVRGGRFRRVLKSHGVDTRSESSLESDKPREDATVFTKPGDLVLEIINVKTGELIGYSYLSGEAIRLNSYTAEAEWFEDATAIRIEIDTPGAIEGETMQEFFNRLTADFMRVKYEYDAGVFEYVLGRGEKATSQAVVNILGDAYQHRRTDGSEARGHLFGIVRVAGDKKAGSILQFQPPVQRTEKPATTFQIKMAVDSVKESGS